MPEVSRQNDMAEAMADAHGNNCCPHYVTGPVTSASPDVFVNGLPAARKGDKGVHAPCCGKNSYEINAGSSTVFVNGKALARKGDATKHCGSSGKLISGSADVISG